MVSLANQMLASMKAGKSPVGTVKGAVNVGAMRTPAFTGVPNIYRQAETDIQQGQLRNSRRQRPSQHSDAAEVARHQAAAESAVAWRAARPGSESPAAVALQLYSQGIGLPPGAMYNAQTKQGMQLEWTPEGEMEWYNPHTGERRPYATGAGTVPNQGQAQDMWTSSVRQSQATGSPLLPQVKMDPMASRPPGTEYGQPNPGMSQPKGGAIPGNTGAPNSSTNPTAQAARMIGEAIRADLRFSRSFVNTLLLGQRPSPSAMTLRDFTLLPPDFQQGLASVIGPDNLPNFLYELAQTSPVGARTLPQSGVRV